ncbi:uncharacterized protein LOC117119283 [Anneissia japonica]|uniref:uncharacterized protein LOC117119283 n=1 Tax=Anneissia japonica TaxID=1529436 RepID=UPI0014259587|nr:uncharacterized protein LOC117119283 [Anneissia japonica]
MTADTAASCNIIDECTFSSKFSGVLLNTNTNNVHAYGGTTLKVKGIFTDTISCKTNANVTFTDTFYVVEGQCGCLLSNRASHNLKLVAVKQYVNVVLESSDVVEKYPNVFNGIGQLKNFEVKLTRVYPQ